MPDEGVVLGDDSTEGKVGVGGIDIDLAIKTSRR